MAFDGTMVAALKHEIATSVTDCHISKISQPENNEIILTIKGNSTQKRLLISCNPALPLVYFTENNKQAPLVAPNFCMLLRKHIANGRIINVSQPSLERILIFEIEHRNELGDLCHKKLIAELMGKYSNLIFTDDNDNIIDALRRVPSSVSSLREVLPGRKYFIPEELVKQDPFKDEDDQVLTQIFSKPTSVAKSLVMAFSGISMTAANEIAYRAGLDGDYATASLSEDHKKQLIAKFKEYMQDVNLNKFEPIMYLNKNTNVPVDFSAVPLSMLSDLECQSFSTISEMLETFYREKNVATNIRQKSTDIRKLVSNNIERTARKLDIQRKQLKDTEKMDKWKLYGELLLTYQRDVIPGATSHTCLDYYSGKEVTITLDPTLTALENSNAYFEKYNKLKRTRQATEELVTTSESELEHLESIEISLAYAQSEDDLAGIKQELMDAGYVKKHQTKGKGKIPKGKPLHFISSDGFDIYVGKNNLQNDELTFNVANGGDWWFHAKKMPGSHVIVKTNGQELPDSTFEEAGRLAAHFSKGSDGEKVEIDYVKRKEVKKPGKNVPGFVIYHTNYSMISSTDITGIKEIND